MADLGTTDNATQTIAVSVSLARLVFPFEQKVPERFGLGCMTRERDNFRSSSKEMQVKAHSKIVNCSAPLSREHINIPGGGGGGIFLL